MWTLAFELILIKIAQLIISKVSLRLFLAIVLTPLLLFTENASAQTDTDFSAGGAVRVGDSTDACVAGIEGAIRYNADSNDTLDYCTGSGWVSLLTSAISGGIVNNGNSFSAPMVIGTNDSNTLSFETNGSTHMTIDTSGNVGIGTTSPTSALQIFGSSGLSIGDITPKSSSRAALALTAPSGSETRIEMTGNRGAGDLPSNTMEFYNDSTQIAAIEIRTAASTSTGEIQFSTNDGTLSERVRIASNGNVGIGTTAPNEKLTLEGGMSFKEMTAPTTDVATYHKLYVDSADDKLKFRDESGTVTDLLAGGGSGDFLANGSVPMTGAFEAIYGTNGSPSITFNGDEDNGFYRNGADSIGVTHAGVTAAQLNNTAWTIFRKLRADNGGSAEPEYSFNNNIDTGMFDPAADTLGFSTAGLERVRIDSSGNVGIGTTAPNFPLEIFSSVMPTKSIRNYPDAIDVAAALHLERLNSAGTGADGISVSIKMKAETETEGQTRDAVELVAALSDATDGIEDGQFSILTKTDGTLTEKMTVTTDGNVGIGTTTPTDKLTVYGDISANDSFIIASGDGSYAPLISSVYSASGSEGPQVRLRRSRGTESAPISLTNGESSGIVAFQSWDGSGFSTNSAIRSRAAENQSATNMGGSIAFETVNNGTVTLSEKMRIDHNGNVGIGTTSPAATLEVVGEVRSISSSGNNRLWGQGRPGTLRYGTTGVELGLCTNGAVNFGLSYNSVHWEGAASACPQGTWVCTASERGTGTCNTARPDHASNDATDCSGSFVNYSSNNHNAWVADIGGYANSGYSVSEQGTTNNGYLPCNAQPIWCCSE